MSAHDLFLLATGSATGAYLLLLGLVLACVRDDSRTIPQPVSVEVEK